MGKKFLSLFLTNFWIEKKIFLVNFAHKVSRDETLYEI